MPRPLVPILGLRCAVPPAAKPGAQTPGRPTNNASDAGGVVVWTHGATGNREPETGNSRRSRAIRPGRRPAAAPPPGPPCFSLVGGSVRWGGGDVECDGVLRGHLRR